MADVVAVDILNEVERIEQQKANYCGPACCQMFAKKYSNTILQPSAFEKISQLNIEPAPIFWSDPSAIANFLTAEIGQSLKYSLVDYSADDLDSMLKQMYFAMNILRLPCITLISKGMHWVVLDGFREQVGEDDKRSLLGAWVEDPWFDRPSNKYLTMTELLDKGYFSPIERGQKWRNKYVFISSPHIQELSYSFSLKIDATAIKEIASKVLLNVDLNVDLAPEDVALNELASQGFSHVSAATAGGGAPLMVPITVQVVDSPESYDVVPLDATNTSEFQDYIYAALESGGQKRLLEVERMRSALDVYTDAEALAHLAAVFPGSSIELVPGYFWERGRYTKSRFEVARKFQVDAREMFLLHGGQVVSTLSPPDVGG